jgi:hypothetical protein
MVVVVVGWRRAGGEDGRRAGACKLASFERQHHALPHYSVVRVATSSSGITKWPSSHPMLIASSSTLQAHAAQPKPASSPSPSACEAHCLGLGAGGWSDEIAHAWDDAVQS